MTTEEKISSTLLDEGIYFKIHIKSPSILRLIGKKTLRLRIRNLYMGTLLKIAPKLSKMKIKAQEGNSMINSILENMTDNIDLQADVVAMAIINKPVMFWKPILKRFLLWNLDAKSMSQLVTLLLDKMNIVDFMSSIVSIGGLQILKKETSLENDTGGKIAPGSGLDQSSNITDSPLDK